MANAVSTQTSQTAQITPYAYGPQQITDLIVNNMIISKFGEVFKNDIDFSPMSIIKLLALMSTTELKTFITHTLTNGLEYLKKSPHFIYFIATNIVTFIANYRRKRRKEQNTIRIPALVNRYKNR